MFGLKKIVGVFGGAVLGSLCALCICGGSAFGEEDSSLYDDTSAYENESVYKAVTEAGTTALLNASDDSTPKAPSPKASSLEAEAPEEPTPKTSIAKAAVPTSSKATFTQYAATYPGRGLVADVEYLNWRTSNANQTFARSLDPVWLTTREEKATSPSGSGLRARLGFRFGNGWDVSGVYAYFNGKDSSSVGAASYSDSRLTSPFSRSNLGLDEIAAESRKKLNMYDLEIGRQTQISTLDFRPFASLRIADLSTSVNETCKRAPSEMVVYTNTVAHTSETLGYGVRIGGEARVKLWRGLAGFGRGAGAVLIGDVDATSLEIDEEHGVVMRRSLSKTKAAPMLEAAAGLEWRYDAFSVKGGYELNSWFNASELNAQTSDELFHGFFAGASWNF